MHIREFQELIHKIYNPRDKARGIETNFLWLVEEVGELAETIRKRDRKEAGKEFADVLAWLVTIATLSGVDIEKAALAKYGKGCPLCKATPCACPPHKTPKRWPE